MYYLTDYPLVGHFKREKKEGCERISALVITLVCNVFLGVTLGNKITPGSVLLTNPFP